MKIAHEWEIYKGTVYPKGCVPVQERETKQAFFAGAAIAYDFFIILSKDKKDKEKKGADIRDFKQQIDDYVAARKKEVDQK